MWNFMDLNCPSDDMVEYETQTGVEELRDIVNTLTEAANILTSENPVWGEMYVLQNIQAKYKRLLRCDKCLVYLHRVSHCLKKMVLLNLSKSFLDLAERFLMGFSSQDFAKPAQLPSLQQVEYILIRTLSATKLLCDGIKYSRETFCFLLQKIKIGHMILDLVMAASVTAKLVVILKAMLEQICNIYQKMLPWRSKLKKGNFEWKEKIDLPEDVKMWLESFASNILKPIPMSRNDMKKLSSLLNKKDQNKDSDTDSVVIVDEVKNSGNHVSKHTQNGNATDYGEVIPRKKRTRNNSSADQKKALLLRINQVQNIEDLEDLWNEIKTLSSTYLPKELSNGKKRVISEFLNRLKSGLSASKKSNQPKLFKSAITIFMKRLGFTENEIEMCDNDEVVSNSTSPSRDIQVVSNSMSPSRDKLVPVKTLKELKLLYKHLCNILQFSNETQKYRKLQKIFKRRRTDIRLLRQNGEKDTAKQLIFCTSKVFLTLCQK